MIHIYNKTCANTGCAGKRFFSAILRVVVLIVSIVLFSHVELRAADITIDVPWGGFTTKKVIAITGEIRNYSGKRATLVINGIPQSIPLQGSRFAVNSVTGPGLNIIEVIAGSSSKKVSFYAAVPRKDIKVLLTWNTATDVDLWVIDPRGEKCYYGHSSTSSGGNLDVDVIDGFGPETFTMANAIPGSYSVQVQYYSPHGKPVTQVRLFVILYEGTSRELRKEFSFVMTRGQQVYHITDFSIESGE